ncbi:hypothetical protein JK635_02350 [Neobacillus sp. YIM B02564]|uniref:Uncharacterized protein n=1 Tax=Neobacillus paridis TaxID=2803862 RepID=A0ABS1TID4_9BACI|nr:hypothetical protein [Neobacillus paridis]MBL4951081.1 hypothetical protein [Neobacillus paridis]
MNTNEEVEYWKQLFYNECEARHTSIEQLHDRRIRELFEMGEEIFKLEDELKQHKKALEEIESMTSNLREYQPSYYTINNVARLALKKTSEEYDEIF